MQKHITNEQKETDAFEKLFKGPHSVDRAQHLLRIYKTSYGISGGWGLRGLSKDQVFMKRALDEGFTREQTNALLDLQ